MPQSTIGEHHVVPHAKTIFSPLGGKSLEWRTQTGSISHCMEHAPVLKHGHVPLEFSNFYPSSMWFLSRFEIRWWLRTCISRARAWAELIQVERTHGYSIQRSGSVG